MPFAKKSRAYPARESDGEIENGDQRIDVVSEPDQMTGPGLRTGARASSCVLMSGMVGRAAIPTPTTAMPATSETTTILRWVRRSAVRIELLFMTDSRKGLSGWSPEAWVRFKAAGTIFLVSAENRTPFLPKLGTARRSHSPTILPDN